MKDYTSMKVELPQFPDIARIICRERKQIYINTAAKPDAKIDYLLIPGQPFIVLNPNRQLPDGIPK